MSLIDHSGKTITLGELILDIDDTLNQSKGAKVYMPMYQRNYKWNQETAVKLVNELITYWNNGNQSKPKSISLFTLYIDDKNNIQVVDGQQRLITLLLVFTSLNKENKFIHLQFERDFSLTKKRSEFIRQKKNTLDDDSIALSDKRRLLYNYQGISQELQHITDNNKFVDYILNNVTLLLHVTKDEPISEFLNLNCNRTKFSICDRIRSALITYPTFNDINDVDKKIIASILDCSEYKKGISILFEEITHLLYKEDIYNTIKLGYVDPDETNENRINILFSKLIDSTKEGYMNCKAIDDTNRINLLLKLAYYKKMLKELDDDCKTYQTHRAFINFYKHRKIRFFELLDNYVDNNSEDNLYDILHKEHSIDKNIVEYMNSNPSDDDIYFVNSYFEVLSNNKKPEENDKYSSLLKSYFKNPSKDKVKYFSLNKDTFEDIVQSSGKYILYRYINEKHRGNQNVINFPSIPVFEDSKRIACNEKIVPITEITLNALLQKCIIIPVIQRDYCMGSHFNQSDKSDMLDYIIDSFNKDKSITLSAITILQQQENDVYIYDGQQRIFTLACLVNLLDHNVKIMNITFENRDAFNTSIKRFFESGEINANNYASNSIANLKKALLKKIGKIDKSELCNYILNKINFDVITVSGELSTAEQFFVEINDGVQLVPYEIFKCKINAKYKELIYCNNETNDNCKKCEIEECPTVNEFSYKKWISDIDNVWLDYFYKFNKIELEDESSVEELMEMRFIEFCCRMICWEKYLNNRNGKHPLELKCFENSGNELGDMDVFIEALTISDFIRITEIMNNLIRFKAVDTSEKVIKYEKKSISGNGLFIIPIYDVTNSNNSGQIKVLITKFIKFLMEESEERTKDIVMWHILKNLTLNNADINAINLKMQSWNNTIIYDTPFAYVTPSFIGKYRNVILPVPSYYYKDNQEGWTNIYEKLPLKDKPREKDLYQKYNSIMMKNYQNNIYIPHVNITQEYRIFYRYSAKHFCDTGMTGEPKKTNNRQTYINSNNGSSFKYLRKRSDDNFYKNIYNAYIDNHDYNKLEVEGLVFEDSNNQFYINI